MRGCIFRINSWNWTSGLMEDIYYLIYLDNLCTWQQKGLSKYSVCLNSGYLNVDSYSVAGRFCLYDYFSNPFSLRIMDLQMSHLIFGHSALFGCQPHRGLFLNSLFILSLYYTVEFQAEYSLIGCLGCCAHSHLTRT